MHIHINGNLGYIGPVLVSELKKSMPDIKLTGFDNAYFAGCLLSPFDFSEKQLDAQYYGDIRTAQPLQLYQQANAVIQLAAISNDPMGKEFEAVKLIPNLYTNLHYWQSNLVLPILFLHLVAVFMVLVAMMQNVKMPF